MDRITSYEDLNAWKRAYELGLEVYKATRSFPREEPYGLTQQVRRSAVSIAANIAEGWGRGATADYLRFLRIARGSAYETRTHIRFAHDLSYLNSPQRLIELVTETEKLINGLIRTIEAGRAR